MVGKGIIPFVKRILHTFSQISRDVETPPFPKSFSCGVFTGIPHLDLDLPDAIWVHITYCLVISHCLILLSYIYTYNILKYNMNMYNII